MSLTPTKSAPREWFPALQGIDLLCLAGGGGQQAPILAAAGAKVTSFDNSARQLERDQQVAQREGLTLRTVEGDMRDLSVFADGSFDLIVHPCSNMFVPEVQPVWQAHANIHGMANMWLQRHDMFRDLGLTQITFATQSAASAGAAPR